MFVGEHQARAADFDFRVPDAAVRFGVARCGFDRAERFLVELDRLRGAFDGDVRRNRLVHGAFLSMMPERRRVQVRCDVSGAASRGCRPTDSLSCIRSRGRVGRVAPGDRREGRTSRDAPPKRACRRRSASKRTSTSVDSASAKLGSRQLSTSRSPGVHCVTRPMTNVVPSAYCSSKRPVGPGSNTSVPFHGARKRCFGPRSHHVSICDVNTSNASCGSAQRPRSIR